MRRRPLKPLLAIGLLAPAMLLASACRLPRESPTPRFWLLTPLEGQPAGDEVRRSIGVGPVELPSYLDHAGIVTRTGSGRLDVAPYDRWAAPLDQNVIEVLGANLEILVPGLAALQFPWKGPSQKLDMRLVAQVSRFEASDDGAVHLEAGWALRGAEDGSGIGEGRLSIREPLEGEGTEAVVAAMSRALGEMSRRIAEPLAREVPEP